MSVDGFVMRTPDGTITVPPAAMQRLVVAAAESVDGARVRRPRRSLALSVTRDRTEVSLELVAREGAVLPELAAAVQERVASALTAATGLRVARVDVAVEEID